MDGTIKNTSELQHALSMMSRSQTPTITDNPQTPRSTTDNNQNTFFTPIEPKTERNNSPEIPQFSYVSNNTPFVAGTINRNTTSQMSTQGLLYNLSGLQTAANTKLDILTNATYALTKSIERLYSEQLKQTDLLVTIARNTSNMTIGTATNTPGTPTTSKLSNVKVKDFGFTNNIDIMAELLLKLIKQVELQISNRNKQYKSTRDLNLRTMKQVVKTAVSNTFKLNGEIEPALNLPDNKAQSTLKVASKLGNIDGTNPVLTPEAFRELFDDIDCRVFTTHVEKIIERMQVLRILLPYYEADILASIIYPYFNKSGEVMCDWNKLIPRSETVREAAVASATLENRNKIGTMLANGVSEKAAVRAILKI